MKKDGSAAGGEKSRPITRQYSATSTPSQLFLTFKSLVIRSSCSRWSMFQDCMFGRRWHQVIYRETIKTLAWYPSFSVWSHDSRSCWTTSTSNLACVPLLVTCQTSSCLTMLGHNRWTWPLAHDLSSKITAAHRSPQSLHRTSSSSCIWWVVSSPSMARARTPCRSLPSGSQHFIYLCKVCS